MVGINSSVGNFSNNYANQVASQGTTSSVNKTPNQALADALAQTDQLKAINDDAQSQLQTAQSKAENARQAMDRGNTAIYAAQTQLDDAKSKVTQKEKFSDAMGRSSEIPPSIQAVYDATAELDKLKKAQTALDQTYADAKTVLSNAKLDAVAASTALSINLSIIAYESSMGGTNNGASGNGSIGNGSTGNAITDTNTNYTNNQPISATETNAGVKTRDASYWTTANIRTILIEVLSTAIDLGNQKLLSLAQEVDNNNQVLKSLGQTTTNLQKAQTVFGPDDKGNLPVRDGANIKLSGKGTTPSGDIRTINEEVRKTFADPTYTPKTLTATGGGSKETEFMNNYVAMVKDGLQTGVISKNEMRKYAEMNVTQDELKTLATGIKAKQDELSNVNQKLQTQVQQASNTLQTLTGLTSTFLSIFKSMDTTSIQNMK